MFLFVSLIMACAFFIYVIERNLRRSVTKIGASHFDKALVKQFVPVAEYCENKTFWSNLILVLGVITAIAVFSFGHWLYPTWYSGIIIGLSLGIQYFAISISSAFPGDTWIINIRNWLKNKEVSFKMRIVKRLVFEGWSLLFIDLVFVYIVFIVLLFFAQGSASLVGQQLLLYFIPIFSVMWVYRIGDYDEFNTNVRRAIAYVFVACLYLPLKDPLTHLYMPENQT